MSDKERIQELLRGLPDDLSVPEIIREIQSAEMPGEANAGSEQTGSKLSDETGTGSVSFLAGARKLNLD